MMADNFWTDNITQSADDPPFTSGLLSNVTTVNRPGAIAVPIVFAIIFVIGLVGNSTLIFIVLRNKPMRTKPNVLIVNLSIGDFLLILVSVPFTSVIFTYDEWHFGNVICKLNEFMQTLSLGVSIFTLTALSVDRFIAIVYPLASYSKRSLTYAIVPSVVIWVVSTGLALMDLVGAQAGPCRNCGNHTIIICDRHPKEWGDEYVIFRVTFRFIIYFVAPLIVIVCLYVIIAIVLLRQSRSLRSQMGTIVPPSTSPSSTRRAPRRLQRQESVAMAKQDESRKKVAKVVLSFVVIFIVCWLPRHVYVIYYNTGIFGTEFTFAWLVVKIVAFCLMFTYSAINPLALYLLNSEYRRYFHHYLFGCCYPPWRLPSASDRRRSTAASFFARQTMVSNVGSSFDGDSQQKGTRMSLTTRL